ncbi:MAG TPA: GntR family transcriptional regulator, partial [Lichenihabitans sp.]|nr:GntR family transcriptional regulator [Lichenihabitans sp.]
MSRTTKATAPGAGLPSGLAVAADAAILDRLPARTLSRGDGPLYRQLNALLRDAILDGGHPAGSALPREAAMAKRFGVSLITVRQALRDLELEGLIRKRAAKPAVIAAPTRRKPAIGFESLAAIAAATRDRRLVVGSYRREFSRPAAETFGLAPKEACYCLRALLYVGEHPAYRVPSISRRTSAGACGGAISTTSWCSARCNGTSASSSPARI